MSQQGVATGVVNGLRINISVSTTFAEEHWPKCSPNDLATFLQLSPY